ncbi:MAG: hypothetical protein AAFX87_24950 [Bacteroidota bacterium]
MSIGEAIRELVGPQKATDNILYGTVLKVDREDSLCEVRPFNNEAIVKNVRLISRVGPGMIIYPRVGSVIAVVMETDKGGFVGMFSEIEEMDFSIQPTLPISLGSALGLGSGPDEPEELNNINSTQEASRHTIYNRNLRTEILTEPGNYHQVSGDQNVSLADDVIKTEIKSDDTGVRMKRGEEADKSEIVIDDSSIGLKRGEESVKSEIIMDNTGILIQRNEDDPLIEIRTEASGITLKREEGGNKSEILMTDAGVTITRDEGSPQVEVSVESAGITIKKDDEDLKSIITDLITAIKALTVSTGVGPSGPPINIADFAAIEARIPKLFK